MSFYAVIWEITKPQYLLWHSEREREQEGREGKKKRGRKEGKTDQQTFEVTWFYPIAIIFLYIVCLAVPKIWHYYAIGLTHHINWEIFPWSERLDVKNKANVHPLFVELIVKYLMCPFLPHFWCNLSEFYRRTVKSHSMTLYFKS